MKNVIHTSLTITKRNEIEMLLLLKRKYYQNVSDKRMFVDSVRTQFWWRNLLNHLPPTYNEEKVKQIMEDWVKKVR
jgi:hypothetical protein